jgi:hypothetical protein
MSLSLDPFDFEELAGKLFARHVREERHRSIIGVAEDPV